MNLSDLVHRSTHGRHDQPIEPFYIPSTPGSSSPNTTASSTLTQTGYPPSTDIYEPTQLEEWSAGQLQYIHPSPLPPPPPPPPDQISPHHHPSPGSSVDLNPSLFTTSTTPSSISPTYPIGKDDRIRQQKDEALLLQKRQAKLEPMTINGSNVTAENIEDGYIQFILHYDPDSIGDGIEGMMYIRRKFTSVPRTGDLSYTTWDIFVLVNKLHNRQIKNWSQLVGQLGLSDMLGRPQFAQRVKRWMHKYKIDYFFDYLMGTPFDFHAEDEKKYSGCLLMGNYQKRRGDESTTGKKRRRGAQGDATDRPILMAGSRKRMHGDSLLLVDKREESEEDEDGDGSDMERDDNEEREQGDGDDDDDDDDDHDHSHDHGHVHDHDHDNTRALNNQEEEEEEEGDEEDELASAASSTTPSSPQLHASSPPPSAGPMASRPCTSCEQLETTVHELENKLTALTRTVESWKSQMESQVLVLQDQVARLKEEQAKSNQTRKKLAQTLLADP